jgi:hypothetical protein
LSAKTEKNIRDGVAPFLDPSERILTTWIASVRGHQQATAGGVAGMVGGSRAGRAARDAAAAGLTLASPMAFVLTPRSLFTVEIGNAGKVKRLLDAYDLDDIGPMTVRRFGLGASVTLEICGTEVELESRVGASRAFSQELADAKAARD